MKRINEFFDKIFNFTPGYIFGFLTFIIGLTGDILALLFSGLAGDYVMWEKSISILGHRAGGVYLRTGLVISNILAIPFIIYLGRTLKDENINDNLIKLTIGVGIFASVTAVLTGIFSGVNEFISSLHGLFALLSWIGGAIVCFLFGYLMLKNAKFSKSIMYFNFIITGVFASYLIFFLFTNFCNYYAEICYSLGRKVYVIMPLFEWTVIFSILIWYLVNAVYLFNKRI
ncbi:MAG: hypothetical protein V3V33_01485 [Candidatus Lokiarchaeia archaeon]